jgi:hypothetical protein
LANDTLSEEQQQWASWAGLAVFMLAMVGGIAYFLIDHLQPLERMAGISGAHGASAVFSVIFGLGALMVVTVTAVVLGVQSPVTDGALPRPWQVFRNILVVLLGALVGWALALLFTPFGDQDAERLHSLSQAMTAFASGYLVSKVDRFLERSLFDASGQPSDRWLMAGLFGAAMMATLLMTFSTRQYSVDAPAQGPSVRFSVAGAPSLVVVDKIRIAIDKDRSLSVEGQNYGAVNIGSDVQYYSLDNRLYVDSVLRPAPDQSVPGQALTKPKPSPTPSAPQSELPGNMAAAR